MLSQVATPEFTINQDEETGEVKLRALNNS